MLFSGSIRAYHCSKCDENFSEVIPTSVIPFLFIVIISGMTWMVCIEILTGMRLLALLVGLAIATGWFLFSLYIVDKLMHHKFHQMQCPDCGGELKGIQGGFIDGGLPTRIELLIYIFMLLPPGLAVFIIEAVAH